MPCDDISTVSTTPTSLTIHTIILGRPLIEDTQTSLGGIRHRVGDKNGVLSTGRSTITTSPGSRLDSELRGIGSVVATSGTNMLLDEVSVGTGGTNDQKRGEEEN